MHQHQVVRLIVVFIIIIIIISIVINRIKYEQSNVRTKQKNDGRQILSGSNKLPRNKVHLGILFAPLVLSDHCYFFTRETKKRESQFVET
jgi:hypothetical protein